MHEFVGCCVHLAKALGSTTACSLHPALHSAGSHAVYAAAPSLPTLQAGKLLSWLTRACMPEQCISAPLLLQLSLCTFQCPTIPGMMCCNFPAAPQQTRQTKCGAILGALSTSQQAMVNQQPVIDSSVLRYCLPAACLERGSNIPHPPGQAGGCGCGQGLFSGVGSGRVGAAG